MRHGTATFADVWSKLEQIGWLEAVSEDERERLRMWIEGLYGPHTNPFTGETVPNRTHVPLRQICSSLGKIAFDPEDAFQDLVSLINQFAVGSDGLFYPARVKQRLIGEKRIVTFELARESFSWETEVNDWHTDAGGLGNSRALLAVLNAALATTGVTSRFHELPSLDQTVQITIVPDAVFAAARSEGLLPGPDDPYPGDDG